MIQILWGRWKRKSSLGENDQNTTWELKPSFHFSANKPNAPRRFDNGFNVNVFNIWKNVTIQSTLLVHNLKKLIFHNGLKNLTQA